MQITIEIPKEEYLLIRHYQDISPNKTHSLAMSIINGTQLPKGHGRLIDAEVFARNVIKYSHQSLKTIGQALEDTPTIIEVETDKFILPDKKQLSVPSNISQEELNKVMVTIDEWIGKVREE